MLVVVALVWACAAKRWWWLGEEMHGVWSSGFKTKGKTWKEVVREDCQARKLNKEDAVDHCEWRKVLKEIRWPGWVWAGECFFWYRPTWVVPDKRSLNRCCCVGCDYLWSEVQIVCMWSSWRHCHPKTPSSLASFTSRPVLPFWYWLIHVVLEKRPLNRCS